MPAKIRDDIIYDDESGGGSWRKRRKVLPDQEDADYQTTASAREPEDSRLEKDMAQHRAAGAPLRVEENKAGRNLSSTFWGQAWNRNLMAFSHFESRMPRGRTAFRSGRVMDLDMQPGSITALVAGARLFTVKIDIAPVEEEIWTALQEKCRGRIAGVVELLSGEISPEVMELVSRPEQGLFPCPQEIRCSCSCPDYADLCQHSAAVLYATGSRLDDSPQLLFTLRGVAPQGLVATNTAEAIDHLIAPSGSVDERRTQALEDADLSALFDLDNGE